MVDNRLIEPVVPHIVKHLRYVVEFLEKNREEREAHPLLHTSPYYKWLVYSIIRRELFEKIRLWMGGKPSEKLITRLHNDLVEVWRELKEYGLEGTLRAGIMHEVLYWLGSLRAQRETTATFFIAPIHEGIPRLKRGQKEEEELQFRGDFCILWKGSNEEACVAVVDVKSRYGNIRGDKKLIQTARQFKRLGLQFFVASPLTTVSDDFEYMKKELYLLDLQKWWAHRLLRGNILSPYPEPVAPPWLLSLQHP